MAENAPNASAGADADIDAEDTDDAAFGTVFDNGSSPLIAESSSATGETLKAVPVLWASVPAWDCVPSFKRPEATPLPDIDVDVDPESSLAPDSGSEPSGAKDIIRRSTISNPIRGIGARDRSRCPISPIW